VSAASTHENKAVVDAYVFFLYNLICWYGKLSIEESDLYLIVAKGLFSVLSIEQKSKTVFYALLTIGSMAFASKTAKDSFKTVFRQQLESCVKRPVGDSKPTVEVAEDLKKIFSIG